MKRTLETITAAINALNVLGAKDALEALLAECGAYLAAEVSEEECGGYRFSGSARMYFVGVNGCLSAGVCFHNRDASDLGDHAGITVESGLFAGLLTRDRRHALQGLAAASLESGEEECEEN